jgi:hypothetical protein
MSIVWIIVFAAHPFLVTTGPVFNTKEKCEEAIVSIASAYPNEYTTKAVIRSTLCVKIEK